jgi:hypothetical protein
VDSDLLLEARHAHAVARSVLLVPGHENQRETVGRPLGLLEGVAVPGEHEVDLGAAVRDEDLLAVEPDVAVRKIGHACGDPAQVASRLGLGQVHRGLDLTRGEARQVGPFDLLAAVFADVGRDSGLQADDHHEARVGPPEHLQDEAVQEGRDPVAAVLLAHRKAHEAGLPELRVRFANVGGRGRATVGRELGLDGPVLARRLLEICGEGGAGLEDGSVCSYLGRHVHALSVAQGEERFPVDEVVEIEAHSSSEVVLHGGISSEIAHEW